MLPAVGVDGRPAESIIMTVRPAVNRPLPGRCRSYSDSFRSASRNSPGTGKPIFSRYRTASQAF